MIRSHRTRLHLWLLPVVTALSVTVAVEGLFRSGLASGAEHVYSDLWHRLAGVRLEPVHTALVMVDDRSLAARPDEPLVFWTPHFAQAIATLRAVNVKLVAVDFILSGSPERWIQKLGLNANGALRSYDQHFRQQVNAGRVLLAGFRLGNGSRLEDFVLPSPDYLLAIPDFDMAGHIGLANLRSDTDGVVRRFAMTEAGGALVEREKLPALSFAGLAATRAHDIDVHAASFSLAGRTRSRTAEMPIDYAGPPGTYRPLSFATLLQAGAEKLPEVKALAGKVVVIGAGYAGINDVHPTPYSTTLFSANALMPGPEIQANIIETLLGGRALESASAGLRLFVFAASFGIVALLGIRLSPWRAFLMLLLLLQLGSGLAYLAFKGNLTFPLAHQQIGMAIVLIFLTLLRLTREERERARIGSMFGRYVSSQVMTALLESPDLPELGGQSCKISVLFSDIRNFTTISEQLTAKEVVEMLNTYFERACKVLQQEGATIDKFIGDAIMAEFGAPVAQPDHALRAVRAGIALRAVAVDFRSWMRQRFPDRKLPEFDIGVGIHSGEAVIGNIGSSARMEYTAIGDTVNIASRLEGKTKDTGCHILASMDTLALAGAGIVTGETHQLNVKGRSQLVLACEVKALDQR